ncbi:MAG TPA: type III pantothenate kinase [Pyrinomonadaceae bacterium]|nr:type III pantothenate kinase [Pyrinomonadaceae bacterium]
MRAMLLVIDVGNTNTSLGVYDGERLVKHWRLTTARERTVDEYGLHARNLLGLAGIDHARIEGIAISSVVPQLNYTLRRMAEEYLGLTPLFLDHATDTGLEILYDPPSDVGADRIADAVAARAKYGAPCIIVDFGTATTFDAVDAAGRYLGGVIAPGINISSDALFARAARLPRVEIKRPARVVGTSTVGAIQSGLFHGYVSLVDGILRRMMEELSEGTAGGGEGDEGAGAARRVRVVATGGLAPLIAAGSELIEAVDDTLMLDGLRMIYERAGRARAGG